MTEYVKTIANNINLFGPGPTNKYATTLTASNAVSYGSGVYGGTQDLAVLFTKGLSNTLTLTEESYKSLTKYLDNSMVVTGGVAKLLSKWYTNTVGVTGTVDKRLDKYLPATLVMSSSIGKAFIHYIYNSLSVLENVTGIYKSTGGYSVIFPGGVSNLVSQTITSYNSVSTNAGTWTTTVFGATVWS
jgi:hypothetical protein